MSSVSTGPRHKEEDDEEPLSTPLSQHVSRTLYRLLDTSATTEIKQETALNLIDYVSQVDAYVVMQQNTTFETSTDPITGSVVEIPNVQRVEMPPILWNPHYRKSYTLLMWLRASMGDEQEQEDGDSKRDTSPRILYRFCTSEQDHAGVGICVTLGEWNKVEDTQEGESLLETTLTATALPSFQNSTDAIGNVIHLPLIIPCDRWCLVGMTHTFPYLKRPQWSVCVNGQVMGSGELPYPVVEGTYMSHNTLLQNTCQTGVRVPVEAARAKPPADDDSHLRATVVTSNTTSKPPPSKPPEDDSHLRATVVASNTTPKRRDDEKPASELSAPIKYQRLALELHVCSIALQPDVVSPDLQALLFDAGPSLSLQEGGRIICHVPCIPNDTKGSSLSGHNASVGIPLLMHDKALQLQRLVHSKHSYYFGATQAKVLPSRIVVPMVAHAPGDFAETPKVGLVQPSAPSAAASYDHQAQALHFSHDCHVVHLLSDYLLHCSDASLDTKMYDASKLFSLHVLEQGLVPTCSLPFFLAQVPRGYAYNLQLPLYEESLVHLYQLYTNNGEWAATLVDLLATIVEHQGGRLHEFLLQAGLVLVLNTTLRCTLVRAQQLQVYQYDTLEAFRQHMREVQEVPPYHFKQPGSSTPTTAVSPRRIPLPVAEACARLIRACCEGGASLQGRNIRKSSDLAMTAVFGFGLDLDVWGQNVAAATIVVGTVASLYENDGDILRRQIPVQFLLDTLRVRFETLTPEVEPLANHFSTLLRGMLASSLSNRKQISPGEHDVAACLGALSDCALGTVGAHVILTALVELHEIAEVSPRLGRNLIMGQYHEVVAPMLLSRTVFSGEQMMMGASAREQEPFYLWQYHWRLALVLFSWTTSVSGPEGDIAARSTGSLLFASALAGSLKGCLVVERDRDMRMAPNLFLPPPSLALATSGRSDSSRSYADLLAHRLRVMMPLLPGLVVSLVSHPADLNKVDQKSSVDANGVAVLTELLTAVAASFRRVFGTLTQSAMAQVRRTHMKGRNTAMHSTVVKAAKEYVSHLLMVAVLLESHIEARRRSSTKRKTVVVLKSPIPGARQRSDSDVSWVEVSASQHDTASIDNLLNMSLTREDPEDELLTKLSDCQFLVEMTLTDLILSAMKLGGGEASTIIWRVVVATLKDSIMYGALLSLPDDSDEGAPSEKDSTTSQAGSATTEESGERLARNLLCRVAAIVLTKAQKREYEWELWSADLCAAVSRLCDLIEEKELLQKPTGSHQTDTSSDVGNSSGDTASYSRDQTLLLSAMLDLMAYGRDMTGWCQLILPTPPAPDVGVEDIIELPSDAVSLDDNPSGSGDDTDLLVGFPDTAASDHQSSVATPSLGSERRAFIPPESPAAASKVMLPILHPVLRVVLGCLGTVHGSVDILIPQDGIKRTDAILDSGPDKAEDPSLIQVCLLEHLATELKETLTAAIVGLSFPNARDIALNGLASARRAALLYRENEKDEAGKEVCYSLLSAIAEEIRVRYEGERRLRDQALFDAYEDSQENKDEVESSQAVERLILGGDLIPRKEETEDEKDPIEEITFSAGADGTESEAPGQPKRKSGSEDFVLFHEGYDKDSRPGETAEGQSKMGYSQYQGLGSTLEECGILLNAERSDDVQEGLDSKVVMLLSLLRPYLDTWDESSARDAAESELVELFDSSLSMSVGEKMSSDSSEISASAHLLMGGSETAADAMSTFIESSSVERNRLNEIISMYLPSHRFSLQAYAERYCWARFMELTADHGELSMDDLWERAVSDGNRDIRSRLISMPCNPQFRRYIPSYLDHSASHDDDTESPAQPATDTGAPSDEDKRRSTDEMEIGALTKNLLEAGNIEIVDITKKEEVDDEELPEIDAEALALLEENEDDILGDGSLGFPSQHDSEQESTDEKSSTSEGETVTTASGSEDATATTEEPFSQDGRAERPVDRSSIGSFHHMIISSPFSHPPDNSSSILSLINSAGGAMIEEHFDTCLHVKAEGSRKCTVLLSSSHLILEYDTESEGLFEGEMLAVQEEAERERMIKESGEPYSMDSEENKNDPIREKLERQHRENAAVRPRSIRWNLSELSHVYLRRYRLRDSALEMFFIPSGGSTFGGFGLYSAGTSLFLDFGAGPDGNVRRDDAANSIMRRAPPQAIKQWPDRSGQFMHEQLSRLTMGWVDGRITNFDYLLHLNMLAGRSYNDLCQYPVMPWVLSNYTSEEIPDLSDPANFRDLTKPMGALNPNRLQEFVDRFETFSDPTIPPFMYGSHYSTSGGVVLHFLVRMHPFAGLHRQLQGGNFDVADRLFSSVPRSWEMCTGSSAAEVKELTPEWYCNPAFLVNKNKFKLGTSQDGEVLGDVTLPPWAKGSPEKFVEVMRNALESDVCSEMLPDWIDLIFGRKQQGPESIKAHNVFFYLTYYGSVDVASIEDESLRVATELQIAHFGQCPMQLFNRNHVRRVLRLGNYRKLSFYQMLSAYTQGAGPDSKRGSSKQNSLTKRELLRDGSQRLFGQPMFLPFFSAPLSHWVHLDAPPPGPHAALIAVRLAGTDRCLAIDARGIFHSFRWAWSPESSNNDDGAGPYSPNDARPIDKGCFVAQRELPRFKIVPRLPFVPTKHTSGERESVPPATAISKTLFAGRTVLLVLSDGDGRGALSMQLVDPAKASVKGEAIVPAVHSSRITCIATDPIGTAAGHGGVGGELAMVGSADGGASLWRFMSSHYLPLRPRVRMSGHGGARVHAVALSSAIHICASVSSYRCCIFSVGNGVMIRSFSPPQDSLDFPATAGMRIRTEFADTPALALSVQGFVVTVCKTTVSSDSSPTFNRKIITLHLFSLEGVSLGSKALEGWRGVPHKITCTPDGTAVTVCSGRGITIHRLSAITPLEFIDEWNITETEELDENVPAAWDVDFGPSLMRPVVAAAGCSAGSLRLHALPGITPWSERHKKSSMGSAVGHALAKPAKRIKSAVGKGLGLGSRFVRVGKEIGGEVQSDVKERGVGGFLAGTIFGKNAK